MKSVEQVQERHRVGLYPLTGKKIVALFREALTDPLSYNPVRNVYMWFGFAWGLPIPILFGWLEYTYSDQSLEQVLTQPLQIIFLAHPILFAVLFGIIGTIHYDIIKDLQIRSIQDELTGLYNYRYFREELEHRIQEFERYGNSFSLLIFDIDHFKQVNDKYGHQKGDEILRTLGKIFRGETREVDISCRYGGEEFVLILPGTNRKEGEELANRIRRKVHQHDFGLDENLTISGGVAEFPEDADYDDKLIKVADIRMYEAKESGRNQVMAG